MFSTKAENCLALKTQKDVKGEGGLPKKHLLGTWKTSVLTGMALCCCTTATSEMGKPSQAWKHVYKPSIQEEKNGGSRVQGQPGLHETESKRKRGVMLKN